ncbi:NUDIX hydrolase [Chloroflexota bacterium]
MNQVLKQALSQRPKSRIVDAGRVPSAVLIPIYRKQGEYYILFTKRTNIVKDHKGQISFPGGAYENHDDTLFDTALRETTEEIGLPAEKVKLLGELDDFPTSTSNYIISPFVGAIQWPYPLKIDPIEVDEIIEIPISALLDKDCVSLETEIIDGQEATAYFYNYQGNVVWGATARILTQLLDIWAEATNNSRGE